MTAPDRRTFLRALLGVPLAVAASHDVATPTSVRERPLPMGLCEVCRLTKPIAFSDPRGLSRWSICEDCVVASFDERQLTWADAYLAPSRAQKRCSFCDKSRTALVKLPSPDSYICRECVDVCNDIVEK